jgi:hypothetical protein
MVTTQSHIIEGIGMKRCVKHKESRICQRSHAPLGALVATCALAFGLVQCNQKGDSSSKTAITSSSSMASDASSNKYQRPKEDLVKKLAVLGSAIDQILAINKKEILKVTAYQQHGFDLPKKSQLAEGEYILNDSVADYQGKNLRFIEACQNWDLTKNTFNLAMIRFGYEDGKTMMHGFPTVGAFSCQMIEWNAGAGVYLEEIKVWERNNKFYAISVRLGGRSKMEIRSKVRDESELENEKPAIVLSGNEARDFIGIYGLHDSNTITRLGLVTKTDVANSNQGFALAGNSSDEQSPVISAAQATSASLLQVRYWKDTSVICLDLTKEECERKVTEDYCIGQYVTIAQVNQLNKALESDQDFLQGSRSAITTIRANSEDLWSRECDALIMQQISTPQQTGERMLPQTSSRRPGATTTPQFQYDEEGTYAEDYLEARCNFVDDQTDLNCE